MIEHIVIVVKVFIKTNLHKIMKNKKEKVGVAGFEPATSCSQNGRDNRLRYTPKFGLQKYKTFAI